MSGAREMTSSPRTSLSRERLECKVPRGRSTYEVKTKHEAVGRSESSEEKKARIIPLEPGGG